METSLLCVLAYALWTLVPLVFGVGAYRVISVLTGRPANSFPADKSHEGPDWYHRMNRAHLNCVENLPVYACVVFVGVGLRVDTQMWTLCTIGIVFCRIMQTIVHMISVAPMAINTRFTFFALQLLGLGALAVCILQHVLIRP